MGKMTTYVLIMSGLLLVFHIAGLIPFGANSDLLSLLLNPQNAMDFNFWSQTILSLQLIGLSGALIVGLTIRKPELIFYAAFAIFMMNYLMDSLLVFGAVRSVSPIFAILIFAPVIVLFIMTGFEFWRGTDT